MTPPAFSRHHRIRTGRIPNRHHPIAILWVLISLLNPVVSAGQAEPHLQKAPDGTPPLHWAVRNNDLARAHALIKAGYDVNQPNRYGIRPLDLAILNGSESLVDSLLRAKANPSLTIGAEESTLMWASRVGKPKVIERLLQCGLDPDHRETRRGQTALMWAAAEGNTTAVDGLLEHGADPTLRSKGGFTPLLFAARAGQLPVVKRLLRHGVSANEFIRDAPRDAETDEWTKVQKINAPSALGLAIKNAHYDVALALLKAGADPNFSWDGHTCLHEITWVRRPGQGTNSPAPRGSGTTTSLDIVRVLIKHGANINARMTVGKAGVRTVLNMTGATPFLLAARTADLPLMKLLASLGADPLIPNKDQTTPLLVAAGVGVQSPGEDPGDPDEVFEAVKLALELGNDPNAIDARGETAMHGAAYKHAPRAVSLLHRHGAKLEIWNQKNALGWTPLRIATGVHRTMNLRSSPETAHELRKLMEAAGVSTYVEPETNISGATK